MGGVSHTTVARHIARLTDSLSVELFERGGEGFRLTEAGIEILALAQRMEDAGTAIGDRLAGGQGDASGTVRIGAPDGFGNAFLSRELPRLAVAQPSMAFELVPPVPRAHKLWKRDVDIAISLERPETGRVVRRKLVDYDLRLYGAPDLLNRRGGPPETVEDLPRFPFVGYIGDLLYTDELDFNRAIHPNLVETYRAATVQAQLDAVRGGGAGLGVLPSYMARDRGGLVPVLPERVGFQRAYWLLIPEAFATNHVFARRQISSLARSVGRVRSFDFNQTLWLRNTATNLPNVKKTVLASGGCRVEIPNAFGTGRDFAGLAPPNEAFGW